MLANIRDNRTNTGAWKTVAAVVEPTFHDNSVKGADQAPMCDSPPFDIEQIDSIPLEQAVRWAQSFDFEMVTLYLYDPGANGTLNVLSKESKAWFEADNATAIE